MIYNPAKDAVILNERKLSELPQLVTKFKSPRLQEHCLKENIFFDFDFLYAKALLNDFTFLHDLKTTIWRLYNQHRHEIEVNSLMNSLAEKSANPMRDLVAIHIFFTEILPLLKGNPQGLISLLKARLFSYANDQTKLSCLLKSSHSLVASDTNTGLTRDG